MPKYIVEVRDEKTNEFIFTNKPGVAILTQVPDHIKTLDEKIIMCKEIATAIEVVLNSVHEFPKFLRNEAKSFNLKKEKII